MDCTTTCYVLDDRDMPVACPNLDAWFRWMESSARQRSIARHHVGPYLVCTTFLGLRRGADQHGPPGIFETNILEIDGEDTPFPGEVWRWQSIEQARRGHNSVVRTLDKHLRQYGDTPAIVDAKLLGERAD